MGQNIALQSCKCKIERYDLFTGCSAIDAMILFSAPLGVSKQ